MDCDYRKRPPSVVDSYRTGLKSARNRGVSQRAVWWPGFTVGGAIVSETGGKDPLSDMLDYGKHPFPPDMGKILKELLEVWSRAEVRRYIADDDLLDWAAKKNLERGRIKLHRLLYEVQNEPKASSRRETLPKQSRRQRHNSEFKPTMPARTFRSAVG